MTNDGTELEDGWPQAGNPLDVVETDGDFGTESSLLPELARRALVSLLTNLRFGLKSCLACRGSSFQASDFVKCT